MATIHDVARASGVSPATVSYVLNNGPRSVRPATRERVLEAIERLSYDPNGVARALRRKRMDAFGVVFPHPHDSLVTNPYFASILDGILTVAMHRQQNTTLFTGHMWHGPSSSLPVYCDGRCDGLLVIAPSIQSDIVPALLKKEIPFVLISDDYDHPDVSCTDVDNRAAVRLIVEHLASLGHRRIVMAAGPEISFSSREREIGYRDAMNDLGLTPVLVHGDFTFESGQESAQTLMGIPAPPTAIFGANDAIALGLIASLWEMGLEVPRDVSVVGFDDIPAAASSDPPLTTIRQPLRQIGERALELLLEQIARGKNLGRKEVLPTELLIRCSTAPAR